ncbi:MAG: acetate/propionate family kinase [Terriglobales bacterium]
MRLLTVNTGSSSLRAGLYAAAPELAPLFSCRAEAIGARAGEFEICDAAGAVQFHSDAAAQTHGAALAAFLHWLGQQGPEAGFDAVAHRLVVASGRFLAPRRLDPAALADLELERRESPDHLPQAIAAIEAVSRLHPRVPQIGCSDSAFHATMPPEARTLPLPSDWRNRGIQRWGYHGLSCASVLAQLATCDPAVAQGRLVVAHLGNGASLTAIRAGRSVDTTMGMTPCGGLIMSSRGGDLDPGVIIYLQSQGLSAAEVNRLLNHESGLLGISGLSADMRTLLTQAPGNAAAQLAVDCFVWQARKHLAAMAASLGGLECLVFTGGIGEHAATIRARICEGMQWMGLSLDPGANQRHAERISAPGSPVTIRIVATDENQELARQAAAWLREHPQGKEA